MTDAAMGDRTPFLWNAPAQRGERVFAGAIVAGSALVFLAVLPFAKAPLPPLPPFIALYQSALVINDLLTAAFLLGQGRFSGSRALGLLAGAYLFTALMAVAHALTFPGLFAPGGLLGAGPQTTAWLYMFWHGGFPLFLIAYAMHRPDQPSATGVRSAAIWGGVGLAVVVAVGFTLLATSGQHLLPAIMVGNRYTPVMIVVVSSVWALNLLALLILARRQGSVLDLWLAVVCCAWLFDIALSAVFNAGRYDLGFYAGRIYGLVAASLVLVVLLNETCRLYMQLVALRDSDRQKAAELQRLTTLDPLTGIANRRAFDEALDREWRRMLRHEFALSLLMIDVDYFKRFNDSYGHVAGDQCLRAVAHVLAGRTRRAGELAARYGGEEFAILLPHVSAAEAGKLAEQICRIVREQSIPHVGSAVAPHVTVSIGVASIAALPRSAAASCGDGATGASGAAALVEAADQALYQAKQAGRNRTVIAGGDTCAAGIAA